MIKVTTICFLINFIALKGLSQSFEEKLINLISKTESIQELDNKELINAYLGRKKFNLVQENPIFESKYEFGISQKGFKVLKKKKWTGYFLLFLEIESVNEKEIVYTELLKFNSISNKFQIEYSDKRDGRLAKDIYNEYKAEYGKDISFECINRKPPYGSHIFGVAVGYGGTMPEMCKNTIDAARKNDVVKLSNMLYSIDPVYKAYGLLGLKIIEKNNEAIGVDMQTIMNKISKSNLGVNFMHGCICCQLLTMNQLFNGWDFQNILNRYTKK